MNTTEQNLRAELKAVEESRDFWMRTVRKLRAELELEVPIACDNTLVLQQIGMKWYLTEFTSKNEIVTSYPSKETRADAVKLMNKILAEEELYSGIKQERVEPDEPEEIRFLIEYTVNLHHTIEVVATDEEDARIKFEEMYAEGLDREEYDISHEVTSIEPTAMQ